MLLSNSEKISSLLVLFDLTNLIFHCLLQLISINFDKLWIKKSDHCRYDTSEGSTVDHKTLLQKKNAFQVYLTN